MFTDLKITRTESNIEGIEAIKDRIMRLSYNGERDKANILQQSLDELIKIEDDGNSDFMNLFKTHIYSELKWTQWDYKELWFEDRIMMELDLPKKMSEASLIDCFLETLKDVYFNKEDNEIFCKEWNKITDFTRKEWISRLPKIMIIHLKRFEINDYGEQQRNNMNIEFPIKDLDVSPMIHICFKESIQEFKYNLYGISIHEGTLYGGHYTANIKNFSEDMKWYKWNDISVWDTAKTLTNGPGPYVLFYHRNDVING